MGLTIENITNSTYWNGSAFVSGSASVTATGGSSWSYPLAASALTVGNSYTVTASATDSAGNNSTSNPTATFNYDNTAPTVAVSSPVNGTTYGSGTAWPGSLTATASANAGGADITGVGVSIQQGSGGCWTGSGNTWTATCPNYVATTYSPGSWSLSLPSTDLNSGDSYTMTTEATDSLGNSATTTTSFSYGGIAFVEQVVAPGGTNVSPENFSLPSASTVGDTLILLVGDDHSTNATVSSVSGGGVATWTKVTEQNGSSGDGEAEIWYGPVTSSASSVTVTLSGSTNWQLASVSEWSGIASSSPVDASTSSAGSATSFTAGPITTTQTGDLVISDAWTSFNSPGFTSPQDSTTSGYTALSQTMAGGSYYRAWGAYTIDSSTGSISAGWTGPGSGFYATAIAAFKP